MSEVAVEEVEHKVPECAAWLKNAKLQKLPVSEAILLEAMRVKALLGIEEERYGKGVDENDLIIIATAKMKGYELVTNEAVQLSGNKQRQNWKIPAVCDMDTVHVAWISYLNYLKRTGATFG